MSKYKPVKRTIYLQGRDDFPITVSDGDDGFGDENMFALNVWGVDVYITRRDWSQLRNAVEEYFAEMDVASMEAENE